MTEFAVSVKFKSDGTALVNDAKVTKAEIEKVSGAAKDAGGELKKAGAAAKEAGGDLGKMADGAKDASGELKKAGAEAKDAARDLKRAGDAAEDAGDDLKKAENSAAGARAGFAGVGASARTAATGLLEGAIGAEASAAAIGAIATPAGIAVAAIGALAAGFLVAYNVGANFVERMDEIDKALGRAGVTSQFTADGIVLDANRIAASSGRSFEDVKDSLIKLATEGKYTAEEIAILADRGADLAATFGGEVQEATDQVATAFTKLGEGDARALGDGFNFVDAATRNTIVSLVEQGKTAQAQQVFLEALARTTHGDPGSVSSAFGEAASAIGDWIGALAASSGPIQAAMGWMRSLSAEARQAAADIRAAAYGGGGGSSLGRNIALGVAGANPILGGVPLLFMGGGGTPRRAGGLTRGEVLGKGVAGLLDAAQEGLYDINQARLGIKPPKLGGGGGGGGRGGGVDRGARDAAKAVRELDRDLNELTRRFDPATQAGNAFVDTMEKISRLEAGGRIDGDRAARFRAAAEEDFGEQLGKAWKEPVGEMVDAAGAGLADVFAGPLDRATDAIADGFEAAGFRGAKALKDEGLVAAQAIAQVLGSGTAGKLLGVLTGFQTGNFNTVGGRAGGLLTLLAGGRPATAAPGADGKTPGFGEGLQGVFTSHQNALKRLFSDVFGERGLFGDALGKKLGEFAGKAAIGAQYGSLTGSSAGGAIGGALGEAAFKKLAPKLFSKLGDFAGPLGTLAGGLLGGVVGGLFKSVKKGSTAIVSGDGGLVTGSQAGNSASFKAQSKGQAGAVIATAQNIADQLGGIITDRISLSVGYRDGKPVVDTTGRNRTKGAGVVKFAKGDEAGAQAFAVADAIADGLIGGLSAKVTEALKSSTDLDRALREALKVDAIEQLLAGFAGPAKKALVDFERQAKERFRIASKYGFDVVALEKETAKERVKLFEATIADAVGGLKQLLEDMITGEKAAGSPAERLAALRLKADELKAKAGSDPEANDKLAQVLDQLYAASLEANGSAGEAFAADRAFVKSTAEAIVAQATAEITAAQEKARASAGTGTAATDALLGTANAQLADIAASADDNFNQNAQMIAILKQIAASGNLFGFDYIGRTNASLDIGRGIVR